jgi:FAD/FMN-containing dehydrogenase
LNGSGVNVVGGRVPGPGTGGFTLGGGYSWLSDQYGLTCDTVISYNLVLPNGSITTVEASSNSDLTFALKGGLNRFGIVTSIVYKTVPQPNLVYGGYQYFESSAILALINATYTFQTKLSSLSMEEKPQELFSSYSTMDPSDQLLSIPTTASQERSLTRWQYSPSTHS